MSCQAVTKTGNRCTRNKKFGDFCAQHSKQLRDDDVAESITITFCERAENHVGMEMLGEIAEEGFHIDELEEAKKAFEALGKTCELIYLNQAVDGDGEAASILIVRNFAENANELFKELKGLNWDKKALMYGRVVNKKARHNLCFTDFEQEPDYIKGRGRVINFENVPKLDAIRKELPEFFGEKAAHLFAEGNHYYDLAKTYIGFHGDAERKLVIALRLGNSMPLYYQWYLKSEPIGELVEIMLNSGDLYAMSEKATGNDWKKRNRMTLRHGAGNLLLLR